jgi:cytoskeletal protein CcmA (bactofilin family)
LTLKSRNSAVLIGIALALVIPCVSFSGQSLMQRGDLAIEDQKSVDDVVVADGNLVVSGNIQGSVFVVNGDALLEPGSCVDGNLTIIGGSLWVSRGAEVAGEINIFSGKAHMEEGAKLGSQMRAMEEVSSLTEEKLALISRYILFNRKIPSPSIRLENLEKLDLGMLRLKRLRARSALQLNLLKLGKTGLSVDDVQDSYELLYKGHDVDAGICAVRFNSGSQADKFWNQLRTEYEERVNQSVHNSLGEGAHWYFRHGSASYCMWYKDQTFQAVAVMHEDSHPEDDEWEEVENMRDRILLELKNFYELSGQ